MRDYYNDALEFSSELAIGKGILCGLRVHEDKTIATVQYLIYELQN